ncbi:Lcl domain-containing protein [Duganella sp. LjRoot269]|uniref:Lcl domain-containing protein n=1 Tax=Duganella sp. LjRoot269 TaxID=3342305 RepID=UPI003ED0D88C
MIRHRYWMFALVWGLLAGCGGGGDGGASPGPTAVATTPNAPLTASVAGKVTVKGGAPLAGVVVTAYQTNNHTSVQATTDANGNYSFSGLMTGTQTRYEIWATKAGYGFYPVPANGSATALKSDHNALYRMVLSYMATSGSNVTGGNFDAYDGSNRLLNLAASGQQTSYAAGDDGALKNGLAWPTGRFVDLQNGSVSDKLTGLVWTRNAACFSARNWLDALAAVKQMANGMCGLSDGSKAGDWRLPNVIELESLVDISRSNPALAGGHPFLNVAGPYWSSTTYRGVTEEAWVIDFKDGRYVNDLLNNLKATSPNGVWAVKSGGSGSVNLMATGQFIVYAAGDDGDVRSGVGQTSLRFVDGGNGTVKDTVTGLVWLKQANCIRQSWAGALAAVRALSQGQCGLTDGSSAGNWHMPNRAEMLSLTDRAETNMALRFNSVFQNEEKTAIEQAAVFNNFVELEFYWTSSTDFADPTQAWTVFSCDYGVYSILKGNTGYTLAVRGP